MKNNDLIKIAKEWLESLKGTRWEIKGDISKKDLIQIGKNRVELLK